jgi:hypothetical protein
MWPEARELAATCPLPAGYRYQRLTRRDIAETIRAFAAWYPGIAVGNASCHLRASFYEERVALDRASERDFYVVLVRKGRELVGVLSVERDHDSAILYGRVGAISPRHRGLRLSERFPTLIEALGRTMGMGMVYGLATLKHPYMAEKFEQMGWQLIGIIPGFDIEVVEAGAVKRVYEAIYTKVLADERDFLRPRRADMTPKAAALFDVLFPGRAEPSLDHSPAPGAVHRYATRPALNGAAIAAA